MQKISDLADLVSGKVIGDPSIKVKTISEASTSTKEDLVFVFDQKKLNEALNSQAVAIVAPIGSKITNKTAILVKNPRLAMAKILKLFATSCEIEKGIHKTAVVHKSAQLGKDIGIGPLVYIGPNTQLGDGTIIHPNVTIYERVKIGKRCIIHSGAVIGTYGFGFEQDENKNWIKIPQIGNVIIEDDVEIFANTCIARGTIGNTIIKKGTKIDNLNQIAHNCEIGEKCAIASQVGMAGSVKIGNNVIIAGQAGFKDHVCVGENTIVMGKSGVTKDISPNSIVSGFPAIDHKEELKFSAKLKKLAKETIKKV
ncbi:hypothetical protein A2526_03425 [candidate division WOR-1 bacterium RIFOXYD2_FULL_36_8]|uniref:UDP-3-O-acylglucosamine N-acyltransferase n=1 Tax=candidate division WOR-1 bacterium RIFOXYB2_FULL_36_35 TaxID=1802578 RepID=A0A1F4S5P1_UNCSA|nr:MAG: hypothetical protein A2230_04895 [candidate division WOR-1 bacterium RIFOXYA2_FULL_36_21]OGC15742.1 MAG: hypothetical protein A2290_05320 [candidate division WOR-1 bacterium RIFOXYB2_FULL_36_35]OGC21097.1 MAG: hypothetical protein A2282_03650 [candidate division WOR-1 bacterium RIFOXYA12_FULL_36_13]OGC41479.1 MAG: hypothetical protein A2526_03425 [candidate division WOR-1 bacterium RIFOXYD2_FULL_36_8]